MFIKSYDNLVRMQRLGFDFEDFLLSCSDFTYEHTELQYQIDLWNLIRSQVGILGWQHFNEAWLKDAYPTVKKDLDKMGSNFGLFQKVPEEKKIEVLQSLIETDIYFQHGYTRMLKYLSLFPEIQ